MFENFLLFIGANDMHEIGQYIHKYKKGLFIEADPDTFQRLVQNLDRCNATRGTEFRALRALITNQENTEYEFHIFNNSGASSSIFTSNPAVWPWKHVKEVSSRPLTSTRMATVLKAEDLQTQLWDCVVDVQGAEMEVLLSFDDYLQNVENLRVEVSARPFYKGGVMFEELNDFLVGKGFVLKPQFEDRLLLMHQDVEYVNSNVHPKNI